MMGHSESLGCRSARVVAQKFMSDRRMLTLRPTDTVLKKNGVHML